MDVDGDENPRPRSEQRRGCPRATEVAAQSVPLVWLENRLDRRRSTRDLPSDQWARSEKYRPSATAPLSSTLASMAQGRSVHARLSGLSPYAKRARARTIGGSACARRTRCSPSMRPKASPTGTSREGTGPNVAAAAAAAAGERAGLGSQVDAGFGPPAGAKQETTTSLFVTASRWRSS